MLAAPCLSQQLLLTKLDERVGPRHAVHLAAVQPPKLARKLLQVLERQLLGVALEWRKWQRQTDSS
jgi:hypothetical protein